MQIVFFAVYTKTIKNNLFSVTPRYTFFVLAIFSHSSNDFFSYTQIP